MHEGLRFENNGEYEKTLETAKTPEEFLATIDFAELNRIVSTLRQRSGVEKEYSEITSDTFKFEPVEVIKDDRGRIVTIEGRRAIGSRDVVLGWEEGVPDTVRNLRALRTLIHESLHDQTSASEDEIEYLSETDPRNLRSGQVTPSMKNGYAELQHKEGESYYRQNTPLNEAMTETLALEILHTYLERTGQQTLLNKEVQNEIDVNYFEDRVVLQIVVQALTERLKIEDTNHVWQGFVRGYFSQEAMPTKIIDMIHAEIWSGNPLVSRLVSELSTGKSIQDRGDAGKILTPIADSEFHKHRITDAINEVVNRLDSTELMNALGLK